MLILPFCVTALVMDFMPGWFGICQDKMKEAAVHADREKKGDEEVLEAEADCPPFRVATITMTDDQGFHQTCLLLNRDSTC